MEEQAEGARSAFSAETPLKRAQLDATAFQLDEVDRAGCRMGGSCDDFGNLLQTECFESDRSGAQLPVPTNEPVSGSGCPRPSTDGLPDGR